MGKFEEVFSEPMSFSDGTYVISGEYSKEDAAEYMSEHLGEAIAPESLTGDRVRFGFPPEYVAEREELGACWFTGAGNGKGTKPVWVWGY